MSVSYIEASIATLLSDKKAFADFYGFARDTGMVSNGCINAKVDGVSHCIPLDSDIAVVTRVIQFDYHPTCVEVRVVLAIGGVLQESNGVVVPGHFFAKLFYNDDCQLIDVNTSASQFDL